MDRAVAYLESGQLDNAQRDYEMLQTIEPDRFQTQIHYGLGEIAYRNKDRHRTPSDQLPVLPDQQPRPPTATNLRAMTARSKQLLKLKA